MLTQAELAQAARQLERLKRNQATLIAKVVLLERHIREQLGCADCGALPGHPCKPEYGCAITDRRIPSTERATVDVPRDCDPQVRELAELIASFLANRENRYSVEVRSSVVHTRMYIGATHAPDNEHFFLQIDKS